MSREIATLIFVVVGMSTAAFSAGRSFEARSNPPPPPTVITIQPEPLDMELWGVECVLVAKP